MPKLPGISRATAVRVFTKLGFRSAHEGSTRLCPMAGYV
jgi:hypothetical protein